MENHLNISNQFVPYELAVKLRMLGFKDKCLGYYDLNKDFYIGGSDYKINIWINTPLWQQAFDFMLKKYNLYGIIIPTITMHWTFKTMTVVEDTIEVPPYNHVDGNDYINIQEASQACLEKLIELVSK